MRTQARRSAALLTLAGVALLAPDAGAADRIYWGNAGGSPAPRISFANVSGGGGGSLSTSGAAVNCCTQGAAIDLAAGRIYWGNDGDQKISFARLDGSGGDDLNTSGVTVSDPYSVATDPAGGRIYWGNHGNDKISFAKLDGSGGGGNLNTAGATVDGPQGLAIDRAAGRIYWANSGSSNTISFAKLDGSGGGDDLDTSGATVQQANGVAIDRAAGRIYWANNGNNKISFAKLDGSGGGDDLDTSGATVNSPYGVAIDSSAGRIYWANYSGGKISFAKLDGSGGGDDLDTSGATVDAANLPSLLKAPSGTGAPAITGGSTTGSALSCSQGSWAGDMVEAFLYRAPQSFAYQWSRDGVDIGGATASSHTASVAGDYRCRVRATNVAGSVSQTSAAHAVMSPPPTPLSDLFPGLDICIDDALAGCPGFGVGTGKVTTITKRGSLSDWTLGNPGAGAAATIKKPATARDCTLDLNLSLKERTYARFDRKLKRKLFNDRKPRRPTLAASRKKKRTHVLILARKRLVVSADESLTTHLKARRKARKLLKRAFKLRKKRKFKAKLAVYAACNGLDGLASGKRTIKLKLKLPAKKKR